MSNPIPQQVIKATREVGERLQVPFDLGLIRKSPGFEIPDIEGTVEGWRAWVVDKNPPPFGTTPKLMSVSMGNYTWYPQQTAEAECYKDHVPGDARCTCGFYSAKSLKHLMELGYHRMDDYDESRYVKVIGRVACWGQVTEGTQGWRSQYAYPVMIFVPYVSTAPQLVKVIREAFGCKVRLLNFQKAPGSIDQVAAVSGKQEFAELATPKKQGRRCRHRTLPLQGFLAGEPAEAEDGEWWVTVKWDNRIDHPVQMKVKNLVIDKGKGGNPVLNNAV